MGVEYVGEACSDPAISTSSWSSYDWYCRGVPYEPRLAGGGRMNCSLGVALVLLFSVFNFATQSSRYLT